MLDGGGMLSRRQDIKVLHRTFDAGGALSMRFTKLAEWASAIASMFISVLTMSPVWAEDVVNWKVSQGSAVIANADTNSPIYGTGATNSIDNSGIWGLLQTPIVLNPSEEAVLRGRLKIVGHTGAGREFHVGMWKKVIQPVSPNTNPIGGWLGYRMLNGSGAGTGRLQSRNPDVGFQCSFLGCPLDGLGGGSIAVNSGPAPACGSPLLDGSCNQDGQRYFLLAEKAPENNARFGETSGHWVSFEIRVGRYGANENFVSGSIVADPVAPVGDYNEDGTTDAADYTVWRDNLGTSYALSNRGAGILGDVGPDDYNAWRTNFGKQPASPYVFQISGLDINGKPPTNPVNNPAGTYTPHVTFEFDRVSFHFGGALDADQAFFEDIEINRQTIQTLDLLVDNSSGATTIRNTLPSSFEIAYYEITSESQSLRETGWASLDSLEDGDPIGDGWDEAGGSSDAILSEANLLGTVTFDENDALSLGNAFKTIANGGTQGSEDVQFYFGLANGSTVKGTVTYTHTGFSSVPEPSVLMLFVTGALSISRSPRRRAPRPGPAV